MAERRMFALKIIDSDAFLDMPASTQNLYFHLSMRADDDGFISNPKKIMRMIGASEDDIKILLSKRFLLSFDTGIVVIKHWRLHNYIAKDRYNETIYKEEKDKLFVKANGAYTDHPEPVLIPYTDCIQDDDTGKVRLVKVSEVKDKEETPDKPSCSFSKKTKTPKPISCEAARLAQLMIDLHKQNWKPDYSPKPEHVRTWARDIELMNSIDKHSWSEIEQAIVFAKNHPVQQNGFTWASNIMSGSSLRKQFDKLIVQAVEKEKRNKPVQTQQQIIHSQPERLCPKCGGKMKGTACLVCFSNFDAEGNEI